METLARVEAPVAISDDWTPESLQHAIDREKQLRQMVIDYTRSVMREGHHYYTLKEGQKPALSKEGALNLASLFKCRIHLHEPHETFDPDHHYTVRYRVDVINGHGEVMASGDGLCTTRESKYAYRWAFSSEVPTHLDRSTLEMREGRSRNTGKPYQQYKVPNADVPDVWNTCLKMALKRAMVDAVLKLPLVSELFTQDLEEPLEDGPRSPGRPSVMAGSVHEPERPVTTSPATDVSTQARLTRQEVTDLLASLERLYGNAARAMQQVKAILNIPVDQEVSPARIRHTLTRAQMQRLLDEAAEEGGVTPHPAPGEVDTATEPTMATPEPQATPTEATADTRYPHDSIPVKALLTYADAHGLGRVLMEALSHYPDGVPAARLDEIEANLKDRIEQHAAEG